MVFNRVPQMGKDITQTQKTRGAGVTTQFVTLHYLIEDGGEVRNGEQKYLYSEIFYSGQKMHNILVLYGLEVRLCLPIIRISANYVTARNLNSRINSSSYLFQFFEGFCFRFYCF